MVTKKQCEWVDYNDERCSAEGKMFCRGLCVCERHFKLLRFDNRYRAKRGENIPEKSCEIERRVRKGLLKS